MSTSNTTPPRPRWRSVLLAALNRLWPVAPVVLAAVVVGDMFVGLAPAQGGVPQVVATILCCVVAVGAIAREQWRLFRDDLARLSVWPRE